MMSIYDTFIYFPIYNAMVFLTTIMPGNDIGLAVIILTIIVKLILVPVSHRAIHTQKKIKELEPIIEKIKETHKDDSQAQATKIMELYKEHGVNPFSGVLAMFIQIPIIFALFFVFKNGLNLNAPFIYPFMIKPTVIGNNFLGLIDLTQKSLILAILVSLTQFLQVKYSLPPSLAQDKNDTKKTFGNDLAQSMNFQMKYILPVFIGFVAYGLASVVSLYWIVNNLFTILHEIFVRKQAEKVSK